MRADKAPVVRLLKTARGQIDGILKMVEEDQYCIDIVNQIMASDAILKKTARAVLKAHLAGCVSEAFSQSEQAREEKIEEIINLLDKMSK